jgi:uncharacterized repeat protein (TIGR03843 family)
VNNADRKAGHVLEDPAGRLWAVDHGLTFHSQPKLRTVIWEYADERIGPEIRADLERLVERMAGPDLGGTLTDLLSEPEAGATLARLETLLVEGRFPPPSTDRPFPWPLI